MPGTTVATVADVSVEALRRVLEPRGLQLVEVGAGAAIPGSYWGEPEAGLLRERVYVRRDTPVHSTLHEAAHSLCMGEERREALYRDAGGDFDEENAACYLQILLAEEIPAMGRDRMLADMDAWGYTFRLGSARRWFEEDAADARAWLLGHGLINAAGRVCR